MKKKLLIVVKSYPLPSNKYNELVCTAAVDETGQFHRLYPVSYRYMPWDQWYAKYQWVEVELKRNPTDPRPESYRPEDATFVKIGAPLSTENGSWNERRRYVLAQGAQTMCALEQQSQRVKSLGIVRPLTVKRMLSEPTDREWKSRWVKNLDQLKLFEPERKRLEKIPYKFSYEFLCEEPGCRGHRMMIEDWEVGQLYLKMRDLYDEPTAVDKVKQKFFTQMCAATRDTHFFVGTVLEMNTWVVLGVFWPKRAEAGGG